MEIEVGRLSLDLSSIASTADTRHDATETLVGGPPTTVIHDQKINNGELRLSAELGIREWLAAGLVLPMRVYNTSIRYLDESGDEVEIVNPFVHHHNETLTGIGDPWLYARGARKVGGFSLGARLGVTIPLGRTEEDPFALGDLGIPHEHSQFGTGTFGAVAGIEASRELGRIRVEAALLTIQSFYENGHGYQAGDRYAALAGAASSFGTKKWRFRSTIEAIKETAETWGGVVHTDDGNIGRTDILAGLEVTWLAENWNVGLSAKLPLYTHVVGGQLDALGFIGLSVGARFRAFGGEGEGEDEHAHGDDHDHEHGDDHDHEAHAPADWTGLDKIDVITDGSVAPLEPVLGKITVFDFWATWCEPCADVDRELAEIARRHPGDIAVRKVNVVDTDSAAYKKFLGDAMLPHLEVYGRDGKLLWKRSAPPTELTSAVEAAITAPRAKVAIDPDAPRIAIEAVEAGYSPEIQITVEKPGDIRYSCGMDMNHDTIVVK